MKLFKNSRFYILMFSIALSVGLGFLIIPGHEARLAYVRLTQVYGWISIGYLYLALIVTPITRIAPDWWLTKPSFHARRAIGVSAGYFAYLHSTVASIYLLGGFGAVLRLRGTYGWAVLFGSVALIILMIMVATSTDPAVRLLTFPRWKRLHRTVYIAGVAIIIHVLLVGSFKASNVFITLGLLLALAVLVNLEIGSMYLKRLGKR